MSFWIRNFVFAGVLIALAYYLLVNQEALLFIQKTIEQEASSDQAQETAAKPVEKAIIEPPQKSIKKVSKGNPAAEGLSRFYANVYGGDEKDLRVRDNIVYLSLPQQPIDTVLTAKAKVTRPYKEAWRGAKENRPFRKGETLLQKITEYAKQEGLEVMWWLEKDFLIKDPFRIDQELLKTAYQIGKSVEGHFPNGLKVYFCHLQRSIVFIENDTDYLQNNCQLITNAMLKTRKPRF